MSIYYLVLAGARGCVCFSFFALGRTVVGFKVGFTATRRFATAKRDQEFKMNQSADNRSIIETKIRRKEKKKKRELEYPE